MEKTPITASPPKGSSDLRLMTFGPSLCPGSRLMKMLWRLGLSILVLVSIAVGASSWAVRSVPRDHCRNVEDHFVTTYRHSQTRPVGYVSRRLPVQRSDQEPPAEFDSY